MALLHSQMRRHMIKQCILNWAASSEFGTHRLCAAKVQASLRIRAVSPEPPLLAHTSSDSKGTFKQKARSLAPLKGWACAVKICHDGMLEDTNSLDASHLMLFRLSCQCLESINWVLGASNCSHVIIIISTTLYVTYIVFSTSSHVTHHIQQIFQMTTSTGGSKMIL